MAKKLTKEEIAAKRLEDTFKNCMDDITHNRIPIPTYIFKVGDRVTYGRWEYADVLEILEDGKLYKIYQKTPKIEYGKNLGDREEILYHTWIELLPYRDNSNIEIMTENEDVRFSYSQRDICSIIHMVYSFGVDLDADYQRGNVWTDVQKTALIESIFKNIDIGKFTFIRRSFKEKLDYYYEILDGKQRMTALCEFFEGRFKYKDKTFQELNKFDQRHFIHYSISYAKTEPMTDEQKYRYFLKLNVSGIPIAAEHIKKVEKKLKNIMKTSLTNAL